ncbi:Hypothetical protein R9X50_00644100 [Acrodontium crateriforme]|uniref:T6SS Phospholipase effector Tle1-like catalytic domain-containing protein n=1 Tax=Acrodontium crateriforme TaxID=150365 RepID=A0AAQ3M9P0_9PEZI|nr:Hypothetical protein R9X50_00644100 [Acrodontium crateriforme]
MSKTLALILGRQHSSVQPFRTIASSFSISKSCCGGLLETQTLPSAWRHSRIRSLSPQKRYVNNMAANGQTTGSHDSSTKVRHHSVSDEELQTRTKLPKKLIVCCDGTWMDSDNGWVKGKWGQPGHLQQPTNVTRIARAVASEDDGHHPQIVYYQAGIGTGLGLYSHLVGGVSGMGLSENVREAYSFLASNYSSEGPLVDPDSIFLIGFSRGAYTARSLGGFICALGILTKTAMPHFYEVFSDWENAGEKHYKPLFFDNYFKTYSDIKSVKPDEKLARDPNKRDEYLRSYFRLLLELNLTQEVNIKCIGVWDTVGALGIPVNPIIQRILPFLPSFIREAKWFDTRLDSHVQNAYHALALDERRFPYSPAVWELQDGCKTNMKQVWFPGAHSNVGGSYADTGTADITLAWMMDQLAGHTRPSDQEFYHVDWIKFDEDFVNAANVRQMKWDATHKPEQYRGWGRGKVYDSLTFPQNLAGKKNRSPGRYHRTFYDTGNTDPVNFLSNTHEYIHASVRARIDLGGRGLEPDNDEKSISNIVLGAVKKTWNLIARKSQDLYLPQNPDGPLYGWKLDDGHKSHDEPNLDIDTTAPTDNESVIRWVYDGSEKIPVRVMEEDRLGKFERILLEKDPELAKKIIFTNDGWKDEPPSKTPSPRFGKTI